MKTSPLAALAAIASIALLSACGAPSTEQTGEAEANQTSEACADAFDSANDVNEILGEAIEISSDAVGYAGSFDSVSLEQANTDLEALVTPLQDARDAYQVYAAVCESSEPPQVCLDALNSADEIDSILSEGLQSASRSLQYAVDLDTAGLEEETALVEDLTDDVMLARADFESQSAKCTATEGI